ncbi:unnamed protein product [Thlaspi arvense]|uniref:Uncharacterized protein n=1 Tax=Thlaspi arvense TaxID=13288 RepID=A0AAU9RY03_THLAR|nr:unnamed protein product [Thlaspi arvense]
MSDETEIKVNIYFGGSLKKMDEDYEYIGQFGFQTKIWKVSEIKWETFEDFIQGEMVSTSIAIVWYKDPREKMKNIKYVFQSNSEDMFELHSAGKVTGEILLVGIKRSMMVMRMIVMMGTSLKGKMIAMMMLWID